ncbi:MAG: PilZ domain-containing protein [Porticoccaceae bacterium]
METSAEYPLDQSLAYEGELALEWRAGDATVTAGQREQLNAANERALRLLAVLEEHHADTSEEQASGHDLARLEFKINLILELVGGWLAQQRDQPAPIMARLSSRTVRWQPPAAIPPAPAAGEMVLYLHAALPYPLRLPAVIHSAGEMVEARFDGLSETLVELLEKTIFRRHRRQVAQTRPARDPT